MQSANEAQTNKTSHTEFHKDCLVDKEVKDWQSLGINLEAAGLSCQYSITEL